MVFYSFINCKSIKTYFIRRAKRILPPYLFIVITCAIGCSLISSYNLSNYFSSPDFWSYLFSNISFANFIQPTLPGVFESNPLPYINGSLWTMKVEILLYISVPIISYFLVRHNKGLIIICIYVLSYAYKLWMGYMYDSTHEEIYNIMQRQIFGQLLFFYSGVLILLYFDYFQRYIKLLFPISLTIAILSKYTGIFNFFEPICIAVVIIGLAYNFTYFSWMRKYDNVAYGIYLFHFPVIQFVMYCKIPQYSIPLALIIVIVLTLILSIISWKIIEKPVMKLK